MKILLMLMLMPLGALADNWSAYSIIQKQKDGASFKETVYLVNASPKTITLSFPNFQFFGHDDTPAESIGPMGNIVLAPDDAVSFVHIIPAGRKNGFAKDMGIQDVAADIPIKQFILKGSFGKE